MLFLDDGRIELATNSAERAIRLICLSRKNALFTSGGDGSARWAVACAWPFAQGANLSLFSLKAFNLKPISCLLRFVQVLRISADPTCDLLAT